MRTNTLLAASSLFLLAASVVVPNQAHAACTDPAGRCGTGEGQNIRYSHTNPEVLSPPVGITWRSSPLNLSIAYLRARAEMGFAISRLVDPVKGGAQPIFTVDLAKAPLEASWSAETKRISIVRVDSTQESASFDVRYTVRPNVALHADYATPTSQPAPAPTSAAWSTLFTYNYNLNDIFSDIIGNEQFGIDGTGTRAFAPWGLTGFDSFLVVGGSVPQNTQAGDPNSALFVQPWAIGGDDPETPEVETPTANGTFGVYVKANPEFSYKTLSVKYNEQELDTDTVVELPAADEYGDSVTVPVKVRGGVRIDGNLQALPYAYIQQVTLFGISVPVDYTYASDLGISQLTQPIGIPADPEARMEFDFPALSSVEIPIPNVKLEKQSLEFEGTTGSQASGKLRIKNEGKATAKITFEAEGDFQISSQATEISPGSNFELTVRATRNEAGSVTGTVKVITNDPDSPLLTFDVAGEFEDEEPQNTSSSGGASSSSGGASSSGGKGDGNSADAEEDSGCGCKTANQTPESALGGFGLMLAVVGLIRRRRA